MAVAERAVQRGVRAIEEQGHLPSTYPRPAALPLFLARSSSARVQEQLGLTAPVGEVASFWQQLANQPGVLPDLSRSWNFAADYFTAIDRGGHPEAVAFLLQKGFLTEEGLVNLLGARGWCPSGRELFDQIGHSKIGELTKAYHLVKQSLPNPPELLAEALGWREKGQGRTSLLFLEAIRVVDSLAREVSKKARPIIVFFGAGRKAEEAVLAARRGYSIVLVDRDRTEEVKEGFQATLQTFGAGTMPRFCVFENGFNQPQEFTEVIGEARKNHQIILVRADFSQPFGDIEPFGDVAASIMALHHCHYKQRRTMINNMSSGVYPI